VLIEMRERERDDDEEEECLSSREGLGGFSSGWCRVRAATAQPTPFIRDGKR
jgi:hypothetical protein